MLGSRIFVAVVAFGGSALAPSAAPERYVPVTGWTYGSADSREQWWGSELRVMREPVLSAPAAGAGFRRRFRLLMIRSRGMPFAVRIDEPTEGTAIARRVGINNRDLARARISEDRTVVFGRAQRLRFAQAIRTSGLRFAPREARVKPEKPGVMTVCLHPTTYIFELVEAGESRFVYRSECNISHKLRELAETVDKMVPSSPI